MSITLFVTIILLMFAWFLFFNWSIKNNITTWKKLWRKLKELK